MEMKQTRREFVRTLFVASQAAMAGSLLSGCATTPSAQNTASASTPSPNGLKFLIFGDWGRNGEPDQTEVATQMARAAQDLPAQFIVSVGDNFYENGVADVNDPQWQSSFENVYAAPALQVPWQVILGNHDYRGVCQAQLDYGKTHPRWNMPARYFQQTHPLADGVTADFFYLDTSPMLAEYQHDPRMGPQIRAQDVPAQLAWFKDALASSQAQWKIVIGHHPILSGGFHEDTAELVRDILPLLHEHKVQVYFNGHDHDLQHLVQGGLNLFCSGAGSQVRFSFNTPYTKFSRTTPGFMSISLTADALDARMIDHHGRQIYAVSVPRNV
jgi:tartrate-resistant acid phosphatase type 5